MNVLSKSLLLFGLLTLAYGCQKEKFNKSQSVKQATNIYSVSKTENDNSINNKAADGGMNRSWFDHTPNQTGGTVDIDYGCTNPPFDCYDDMNASPSSIRNIYSDLNTNPDNYLAIVAKHEEDARRIFGDLNVNNIINRNYKIVTRGNLLTGTLYIRIVNAINQNNVAVYPVKYDLEIN